MVLGEPQILGQVKDAYDAAIAAGASARTSRAACRARSRWRSASAPDAARRRHRQHLERRGRSREASSSRRARRSHRAPLVGAGEMAERAAKSLGQHARATPHLQPQLRGARGQPRVALQRVRGAASSSSSRSSMQSDVVVASRPRDNFVVTKDLVKRVMKQRKGKALLHRHRGAAQHRPLRPRSRQRLRLQRRRSRAQVAENMKNRQAEVAAAEKIVEAELGSWGAVGPRAQREPTIVALRAKEGRARRGARAHARLARA